MVRSLAQFYLPKLEQMDLRDFYGRRSVGTTRVLKAARWIGQMIGWHADLIVPLVDAAEVGEERRSAPGETGLARSSRYSPVRRSGVSRQARTLR